MESFPSRWHGLEQQLSHWRLLLPACASSGSVLRRQEAISVQQRWVENGNQIKNVEEDKDEGFGNCLWWIVPIQKDYFDKVEKPLEIENLLIYQTQKRHNFFLPENPAFSWTLGNKHSCPNQQRTCQHCNDKTPRKQWLKEHGCKHVNMGSIHDINSG